MGSRLIKIRQGWFTRPVLPEKSGWYQRDYGDGIVWVEWWDAKADRWFVTPGGRKCVMQGKSWRKLPDELRHRYPDNDV